MSVDLSMLTEDLDLDLLLNEEDSSLLNEGKTTIEDDNGDKVDLDEDDEDAVYVDEIVDETADIINEGFVFQNIDPIHSIMLTEEELASVDVNVEAYSKEFEDNDIHEMSPEELNNLADEGEEDENSIGDIFGLDDLDLDEF